MRWCIIAILMVLVIGCGKHTYTTQVIGKGDKGDIGNQGDRGSDGLKSLIDIDKATVSMDICESGEGTIFKAGIDLNNNDILDSDEIKNYSIICDGAKGQIGETGPSGLDGKNGLDGVNCNVEQLSNGAMITCGDTKAVVLNGLNGQNGVNSINKLIAPCTKASSGWKEELLCLSDGTLLASFSDNASGLNTRFSIIPTGNYIDTDNSQCLFNVTVDANNNSTVSWYAGSNSYGTWQAGTVVCSNNN